jgi:DNA-binding CsgD family transcriptional regulator
LTRRTSRPSLIGRDVEWRRLREAIDHVRAGGFRCVFIEGEAGIGKTRLVEELVRVAAEEGFFVLNGSAEELEQGRPFGAFSHALVNTLTALPPTATILRTLLHPGQGGPAPTEPALIDALLDLVEELSLTKPTVLAIEDLHWADPVTIAALRAVGRRLSYLPVLVVGTYRPYPRSRPLSRWLDVASREGAVEIPLQPLASADVDALVSSLVDASLGSGLRTVMRAAGGNPLYVTEIARALSQDGELTIRGGIAEVTSTQLPPTLRLTILRRISFLPAEALESLRACAVLGSAFGIDELVATTGSAATDVIDTLRPAIEAAILEEWPGGLRFRHDLIQEAIYQDVPVPIRSTMHIDVYRSLRSVGAPPARIAEHFLRGLDLGVPDLFEEAVLLAGDIRQTSPGLAVAIYEKADELPGIPEDRRMMARSDSIYPLMTIGRIDEAERISNLALARIKEPSVRVFSTWPVLEAKMRRGRAAECIPVLKSLAGQEGLADLYSGVMWALAIVGHARTSTAAAVADVAESLYARAHDGTLRPLPEGVYRATAPAQEFFAAATAVALSVVRTAQGRLPEANRAAVEAIEIDTQTPTPIPIIFTLPAIVQIELDEFADALHSCGLGRRRDSSRGDATHAAPYSSLESLVMYLAGDWDPAAVEARTALELVGDGVGSADLVGAAHVALSQIALRRGDVNRASELIADMERFVAERGPQWGMLSIAWSRATLLEARGDAPAAYRALAGAWDEWPDRHLFGRQTFADLIRLALENGDRERAEGVTEEVEKAYRSAPDVHSARSVALMCRGLVDDDVEKLLAGVEGYRTSPRIVERSRACEEAAVALLRREKKDDARALFEEALGFYEHVEAQYDIRRVTGAMRDGGLRRGSRARRDRPRSGWEALTDAEQQVARLTVEGLTNPQIAERLFVSKHTVQTHLSHVFAKLGISSRAALAGIAAEKLGGAEQG